jgi:hypothetical protein
MEDQQVSTAKENNQSLLYFQPIFLFFLTIYALVKWLKYYGVPDNFPPGPPCVPFLGVLPFIKVFKKPSNLRASLKCRNHRNHANRQKTPQTTANFRIS